MKFSIIIPVYNVVAELPRTIESLKAQTFGDYEIVLVDDGSTDGSGELVDTYSNIATVLHQKNQGVTVARRNGFGASKGDWILFVDGDDTIKLDTLSSINEAIDRGIGRTDMVCFGFEVVYPHKRNLCRLPLTGEFSTNQLIDRMKATPLEFISSCIGNKCYRREIVDGAFADISDVNIAFREDTLFAITAFFRTKSICMLSKCFYEYVQRNNSARTRFNVNVVDEEETFILHVGKLLRELNCLPTEKVETCIKRYCVAATWHIFGMFIANHVKYDTGLLVLNNLNKSQFFLRFKDECVSPKQEMIRFLLSHPKIYCRFSLWLYFINVVRKLVFQHRNVLAGNAN